MAIRQSLAHLEITAQYHHRHLPDHTMWFCDAETAAIVVGQTRTRWSFLQRSAVLMNTLGPQLERIFTQRA